MPTAPPWHEPLVSTCEGIARLLAPHGEVVLHDIASDTIVGIWNAISGRKVGDPALLAELPEAPADASVVGPYEKVTADGRRLTSVSSFVSGPRGRPVGVLCVNWDRSPIDTVVAALTSFASPALTDRPRALFDRDWREQIALTVDAWCRERQVDRARLSRSQRREIVTELDAADLFATRHAAQHAALALGVSRATVYSLLQDVRDRGVEVDMD